MVVTSLRSASTAIIDRVGDGAGDVLVDRGVHGQVAVGQRRHLIQQPQDGGLVASVWRCRCASGRDAQLFGRGIAIAHGTATAAPAAGSASTARTTAASHTAGRCPAAPPAASAASSSADAQQRWHAVRGPAHAAAASRKAGSSSSMRRLSTGQDCPDRAGTRRRGKRVRSARGGRRVPQNSPSAIAPEAQHLVDQQARGHIAMRRPRRCARCA